MMGKAKNIVILITIIVLLIVLGLLMSNDYKSLSPDEMLFLNGTFTCKERFGDSIAFDLEGGYVFYYLHYPESRYDIGTYEKIADSQQYIMNSPDINHQEIAYNTKKHSFEITIDNEIYLFEQISSIPIIQSRLLNEDTD